MIGTMELRLAELRQEQAKAQQVLVQLEQEREKVGQTYWRITGAITVLEEVIQTWKQQPEGRHSDLSGSANSHANVAAGPCAASD